LKPRLKKWLQIFLDDFRVFKADDFSSEGFLCDHGATSNAYTARATAKATSKIAFPNRIAIELCAFLESSQVMDSGLILHYLLAVVVNQSCT
jgi:hypothetical protein